MPSVIELLVLVLYAPKRLEIIVLHNLITRYKNILHHHQCHCCVKNTQNINIYAPSIQFTFCLFSNFLSNWMSRWSSGWVPVWIRTHTVTLLQYSVITLNISVLWRRDITTLMIQRWRVTAALLSKLILWVSVYVTGGSFWDAHHLYYSVCHLH